MYGENGQIVDVDEVRNAIAQADVLIVGFRGFAERLLIDSRTAGEIGPMAQVVEPVGGVEERMHWLGRNRPQFGPPQRFTFFVWPHSIELMQSLGVAGALIAAVDSGDGPSQVTTALDKLQALERIARRGAVTGEEWRSLWDAQGTRPGR